VTDQEKYRIGNRILRCIERYKPSMNLLTGHAVYVNGHILTVRIEHQHPLTNTLHVAQHSWSEHDLFAISQFGAGVDEARNLWEKLFEQSQKPAQPKSPIGWSRR